LEPLTSGTIVGAGSFCCQSCGYVLTLTGSEALTVCPACAGQDFERASLFGSDATARQETTGAQGTSAGQDATVGPKGARQGTEGQETARHGGVLAEPAPSDRDAQLASARAQISQPGGYICYEEGGELRTVALAREWTRIGRSLAADVRFDDPTVSRRHALIVRQPDGVRVLDDRSLNGVFVNGQRVEGKMLNDGDEIIVGRYRLSYLNVAIPDSAQQHPTLGSPPDAD
jgi:FHA domain-containing protein/zinc ribbon family protein